MKKILTLFLMLFVTLSFAQTGKVFKGIINKTLKITLYLEGLDVGSNADQILGVYQYEGKKDYFLLNGYRNNDGNIILVEKSTANFSGIFFGNLLGKKMSGKWISANQERTFVFELAEVRATQTQLDIFKNAISEKVDEFNSY